MKRSLKIVSKNNPCAVNGFVCKCKRCPIIKIRVPQWFWCDSESLSFQIPINDLYCNFVSGDFELFDFGANGSCKLLSNFLRISQIVSSSLKFFGEYVFDDFPGFRRVKDFLRGWFELISISCFCHCKVKSNVYKPKMLYFFIILNDQYL